MRTNLETKLNELKERKLEIEGNTKRLKDIDAYRNSSEYLSIIHSINLLYEIIKDGNYCDDYDFVDSSLFCINNLSVGKNKSIAFFTIFNNVKDNTELSFYSYIVLHDSVILKSELVSITDLNICKKIDIDDKWAKIFAKLKIEQFEEHLEYIDYYKNDLRIKVSKKINLKEASNFKMIIQGIFMDNLNRDGLHLDLRVMNKIKNSFCGHIIIPFNKKKKPYMEIPFELQNQVNEIQDNIEDLLK